MVLFFLQITKKWNIIIKAININIKEVKVMDEVPTVKQLDCLKKLNTSLLLDFLLSW